MREHAYFSVNVRDSMQNQDSEPDEDQENGESSYQASVSVTQRGKKRANENDINVDNMTTPINYAKRRKTYKGKHSSMIVNLKKHPALKKYCKLISDLQFPNVDEVSQYARHSIAMLKWSVVNYETFIKAGWNGKCRFNIISTPRIKIKSVSTTFEQHPNNQLKSITTTLWSLYDKGIIHSCDISPANFIRWLFYKEKNYYDIDVLTVVSVILAVILYKHTPCRGVGSSPSESHVKIELWSKIFSTAFSLHDSKLLPTWEFQHLISGNAGQGSSRSDFAAVVNNQSDLQFPFFLVEFENNGFEVHKDSVVVIAEAVHEFNRLLSFIHPTEEEQQSSLIYVHDDVLSFNLMGPDIGKNIENALRLTTQPVMLNYDLITALPETPREAVKSREYKTKFTPQTKRELYTIVDESDSYESESTELDSSN
ncbi:8723_t:CDS:2 [Cetraspora pellucida]|uniref:8723_t:CDS:1 n=1 Tax=Cetraspora pellucida TaxID=1433469 RepID=A0A9N9PDA6_9GLOM|nr:8723_t:CDS:2 [Cetraspora pellucida]